MCGGNDTIPADFPHVCSERPFPLRQHPPQMARIASALLACQRWCRPPGDSPGAGRRPRWTGGTDRVGWLGSKGRPRPRPLGDDTTDDWRAAKPAPDDRAEREGKPIAPRDQQERGALSNGDDRVQPDNRKYPTGADSAGRTLGRQQAAATRPTPPPSPPSAGSVTIRTRRLVDPQEDEASHYCD